MLNLIKAFNRSKIFGFVKKYSKSISAFARIMKAKIKHKKINKKDIPFTLEIGQSQWKVNSVEEVFTDKHGNYFVIYQQHHNIQFQYYDMLGNSIAFN